MWTWPVRRGGQRHQQPTDETLTLATCDSDYIARIDHGLPMATSSALSTSGEARGEAGGLQGAGWRASAVSEC
jgi:hypothetical protein